MNLRLLGIVCLIGASCFALHLLYPPDATQSLALQWGSDLLGIVYLLGWMAAVLGLRHLKAMGNSKPKRVIYGVMLGLLSLAMISNLVEPFAAGTLLYQNLLDPSWPLSQLLFLLIGLAVVRYHFLPGWKRFVPLLCGLWFPSALLWSLALGEQGAQLPAAIQGAFSWALLGLVIFSAAEVSPMPRETAPPADA